MAYNQLQKLNDNIEAIRIALAWEKGKTLDGAQVEALQKYSGFGGIKAVLYPNAAKEEWIKLNATDEDLRLYPKIKELHELLKNNLSEHEYKENRFHKKQRSYSFLHAAGCTTNFIRNTKGAWH